MTLQLLLIEDDLSLQTTLQRTLSRKGWHVHVCGDGVQALKTWQQLMPDVVALDLTLPGQDGLELLAQARARGFTTPVLILTARGSVGDRVLGLRTGADDYLPKPYDLDELEARLQALARRRPTASLTTDALERLPPISVMGRLRLHHDSGAVYAGDHVLDLPARELALLQTLLTKVGRAVSREQLFEVVFADDRDVQPDALDVVVYRLRKKLVNTGVELVTLRGLGFLLKASE